MSVSVSVCGCVCVCACVCACVSNTELHTCMVELCGRYLPSVPAEGVNAPARPHVPDLAVVVKGARDDQVPFAHGT